jgi:dUTP pyrophosphatase
MSNGSALARPQAQNQNNHQSSVTVQIKLLPHAEGLALPSYATPQSAGMDLLAAIDAPITIEPMQRVMVPTGLTMALPDGFEAQVRPRSGLAAKNGVTVLNTPGTVDADYRGEVKVILINLSNEPFTIERGMRIAQIIIAPYTQAVIEQVDELNETTRGSGGFGSTGVK